LKHGTKGDDNESAKGVKGERVGRELPPPQPAAESGERGKTPGWVWGRAPAESTFLALLSDTERIWCRENSKQLHTYAELLLKVLEMGISGRFIP